MPSGEIKLPLVESAQKRVISAGSAQSNQQQRPSLERKAAPLFTISHKKRGFTLFSQTSLSQSRFVLLATSCAIANAAVFSSSTDTLVLLAQV